jgi:hypothetical protein
MGATMTAFGQDEETEADEQTFTLSGSIDTYFRSSFGTRNFYYTDSDDEAMYAPSTSFADGKGFSIGMVNLIASYEGEKVGFVGDVVFGPRGQSAVFGTASGQAIVNQLYAKYKFTDGFSLSLGQFNTFLGYEVISPAVNVNYSCSYLFSWGPFNHTGLRADFDFGGGVTGKLAIMNPTDIVEFNPVNTYTLGAQIGFGGLYLNFLYGDQDGKLDEDIDFIDTESGGKLFQADLTAGWDLSDAFYLGVNASFQTVGAGEIVTASGVEDLDGDPSSFFGVAVYPKVTLSESFALALRAEYFMVTNGHLGGIIGMDNNGDGSVIEVTLSGNYKVGGFTFIPEFRIDSTSEESFYKNDSPGEPKTIMPSLTFAAVYSF